MAENAAESVTKGARVVASGGLFTEQWATEDGEARDSTKVHAAAIGASLRFAVAHLQKTERPSDADAGE
ncbi:MAG TPA: single-stranded DNA-binding protein [Ornithinimicrobium sp.]|uniref:single-stranded DNA-binding protein n=1 Tax=Ornithinimicrobium sp. TaxID=1977084 RepID=UPI002B4817E1|nr:single-stranded DNA-binding protein [Ornithinimicrobium sp.]HKJ10919.1 single-stranded DNA-binding protein [Ornithinimicrobium sp.]